MRARVDPFKSLATLRPHPMPKKRCGGSVEQDESKLTLEQILQKVVSSSQRHRRQTPTYHLSPYPTKECLNWFRPWDIHPDRLLTRTSFSCLLIKSCLLSPTSKMLAILRVYVDLHYLWIFMLSTGITHRLLVS